MGARQAEPAPVELQVSAATVSYIILKAREYDAKVDPTEPDPGSDPVDDGDAGILSDYADDPTRSELAAAIGGLNEDEIIDVLALVWVGRGDFGRGDFDEARQLAAERHRRNSARYLIGIPLLGDYLEEGLAETGHSFDPDVEMRL